MNINSTQGMPNAGGGNEQYTTSNPVTMTGTGIKQTTTMARGNGTEKDFIEAIEKANHVKKGTTECQFSVHKETKQVMIKMVNSETKEVIREIPSEKILDMFAKMCEVNGLFVDEKR